MLRRLQPAILALVLGLTLTLVSPAQALDCRAILRLAVERTSKILRPLIEVSRAIETDYQPEAYAQLSLSDRYIQTYKRIQARNHKDYRTMFFYDYEVRGVIENMKEALADAKDFSHATTPDGIRHFRAYKKLMIEIARYERQRHIPYMKFHETTLLFVAFQKKGLKNQPEFVMQPRGRYHAKDHLWTHREINPHTKTSGFNDLDRQEMYWGKYRTQLLRSGPKFVFIPTFESLDEDFFIKTSAYPVFPAGMTRDVNVVVDGQLYGPVLFLMHDFYHAYWARSSVDYSAEAISDRQNRVDAFYKALESIESPEIQKAIRVLFNFMTHEDHPITPSGINILSRSREILSNLGSDGYMFEQSQMRIYDRPYDFGETYGDQPPHPNVFLAARQWLADFLRQDTHYP